MNYDNQIPAFGFSRKTSKLINRKSETEWLKAAICDKGKDTRILFMTGNGGSGKTRLLEEMELFINGNTDDKPKTDLSVVTTGVIDFTNIHLHIYVNFLGHLRKALDNYDDIFFTKYDAAYRTYLNRIQSSVEHRAIKAVSKAAKDAFWEDYAAIAQKKRIVWLLDTAEHFRYTWQTWLSEIVDTDTFLDLTRTFLKNIVSRDLEKIPNTTIIFSGRPNAQPYFDEIQTMHQKYADSDTKLMSRELDFFKEKDTLKYLKYLADDIEKELPNSYDAERLNTIANGKGEIDPRVLHIYTQGQPIRLALFIDLIMEGYDIPEILFDSFEEARSKSPKDIKAIQTELEAAFINLIFESTHDIRSDILLTLARARYGLNTKQLAWILYSKPSVEYQNWKGSEDEKKTVEEIEAIIENLKQMTFIKQIGERWILQDEVYTLFDKHMAQPRNLKQEKSTRQLRYKKNLAFIQFELNDLKAQRKADLDKDKASLAFLFPAKALDSSFAYIGEIELLQRNTLAEKTNTLNLEIQHYQLRANLEQGLENNIRDSERIGLSDANQHAFNKLNLWQLSTSPDKHDPQPWKAFLDIPDGLSQTKFEAILQAREPIDLISTFFFRSDYQKAIETAEKIECTIKTDNTIDEPLLTYLHHPLFVIERQMWKEFAEIYTAKGAENTKDVQGLIDKLDQYLKDADKDDPIHKLFSNSIQDLLGNLYNTLGYAHTSRGHYRDASQSYKEALKLWRETGNLVMEATTRNNHARVLSEMGLTARAERICRDALAIREKELLEQPVGFSHNTLALIYNNGLRPENAWVEAAMGVAYHRRAENERGLALAHFHLAEALRRLVRAPKAKLDSSEQLLKVSEQAIKTALEIFDKKNETGEEKEPLRKIEALIEKGALYRDYVRYHMEQSEQAYANTESHRRIALARYKESLKTLEYADELADKYQYPHLKLDALVDIAWVHYYAQQDRKALDAFKEAKDEAHRQNTESEFKAGQQPPKPASVEPYIFMRLAKLWDLKARIHLNHFKNTKKENDLKDGVEAYVVDLAYNQLYSPRAPFIIVIFGNLYDRLKAFNTEELEDFNKYQKHFVKLYNIKIEEKKNGKTIVKSNLDTPNLIDMDSFLDDSFGI